MEEKIKHEELRICNCGKILAYGKKYCLGHANLGRKQSQDWKRKRLDHPNTRATLFGNIKPWNAGLTKDSDIRVRNNAIQCKKPKRVKEIEILSDGKIIEHKYTEDVRKRLGKNRKGEKNNFYGHFHTEETRRLIGEARKKKPFKRGWKHTPEAKEKNRQAHLGKPAWNKGKQLSETHVRHIFEANKLKPNQTEIRVDNLIQINFPNIFKFVAHDNKTFIGGRSPDWISRDQKKIIEFFGNYWHGEKRTGRTKEQEEEQRINHFKKYGYKTLIIWEFELKNLDSLKSKIKDFMEHKYEI